MNGVLCTLLVVLLALVSQTERCHGSLFDSDGSDERLSEDLIESEDDLRGLEEAEDASTASLNAQFEDFIKTYNKVYLTPQERERRLEIFARNVKKYEEMNEADMGTATYGVDQFSDMTDEEFKEKMLTFDAKAFKRSITRILDDVELDGKRPPKNFNWQDKGKVSPVKNQGACGSCWAFSTVANIEGLYSIKHNKLETFSEQQLVDCDTTCSGCGGGWMSNAVEYIKSAGGLMKDSDYPYRAMNQVCVFNSTKVVVKVKENVMLPTNEKKIMLYLFKNGPVSVALDANAMRGYKGGIAHPTESYCSKSEDHVNHGITLVGYGVHTISLGGKKKRLPYWIAKNSWGTVFGQKGYYLLYRGDGSCAIDKFPSSAVLA